MSANYPFPDSMHSFSSSSRAARIPFAVVVVALIAAGCATRTPVPVEERGVSTGAPIARAPAPAPLPVQREGAPAPTYTVKRGDTMHQIALDNGLDYRELAAWNNIENVNRIYPGQVLRLTAPGEATVPASPDAGGANASAANATTGVTTSPLRSPPPIVEANPGASPPGASASPAPAAPVAQATGAGSMKTSPKAIKEPYSEQAVRDLTLAASAAPAPAATQAPPRPAPADATPGKAGSQPASSSPAPASTNAAPSSSGASPGALVPNEANAGAPPPAAVDDDQQLHWAWPAKGKVVTSFSETANLKGIDIAGTAGEAVRASAPGRVVYAGNGLRGYGKLIIIKHNNTYLSAYAHNRDILVKEGQQVTRGQKIAEMGKTDADQVKLHFEIRRHGKPMDPTKYLPPI
jgi:lipoprotein NlpD